MSTLPFPLSQKVTQAAQTLLDAIEGAIAVVIATADGFDVARAGSASIDAPRLAAMVSSLSALSEAASRESGLGALSRMVVECEEGRLVVQRISAQGHSLVIVVLTGSDVLLGMVLNRLMKVLDAMNLA